MTNKRLKRYLTGFCSVCILQSASLLPAISQEVNLGNSSPPNLFVKTLPPSVNNGDLLLVNERPSYILGPGDVLLVEIHLDRSLEPALQSQMFELTSHASVKCAALVACNLWRTCLRPTCLQPLAFLLASLSACAL